jgi:hypothetical protein
VIKKHGLFILFAVVCVLVCAQSGFAEEASPNGHSLFLGENNSSAALKKAFSPNDFSLPEATMDRLNNENLEKLMQSSDVPAVKPKNAKKKVGKIMVIAGLGAAGAGTIMLIANGGRDPHEIGDSGMGINWKATGIAWIGVGLAVAIAGFILGAK